MFLVKNLEFIDVSGRDEWSLRDPDLIRRKPCPALGRGAVPAHFWPFFGQKMRPLNPQKWGAQTHNPG